MQIELWCNIRYWSNASHQTLHSQFRYWNNVSYQRMAKIASLWWAVYITIFFAYASTCRKQNCNLEFSVVQGTAVEKFQLLNLAAFMLCHVLSTNIPQAIPMHWMPCVLHLRSLRTFINCLDDCSSNSTEFLHHLAKTVGWLLSHFYSSQRGILGACQWQVTAW